MFAAGGSVLTCAKSIYSSLHVKDADIQMRCSGCDIDLFLYGMNVEQAEEKVREIYTLIKQKVADEEVMIVRSKHAITFCGGQFPPIQVITRLYKSPAEILIGFDLDSCVSNNIWFDYYNKHICNNNNTMKTVYWI